MYTLPFQKEISANKKNNKFGFPKERRLEKFSFLQNVFLKSKHVLKNSQLKTIFKQFFPQFLLNLLQMHVMMAFWFVFLRKVYFHK